MDTGTGCVHIAPGHGEEDYIVGQKYGLEPLAPVDDKGLFSEEVGLPELVGKKVFETNRWIDDQITAKGLMVKEEDFEHSYPHCWRCKRPVIFRSTAQWFLSLNHDDLRQKALDSIRRVEWIPEWGRERIYGMVLNRPDWCLSRQRSWGVPIMAFECQQCGDILLDAKIIRAIADRIEKDGADIWYDEKTDFSDLMPNCSQCQANNWKRESDILDVWFDSGVSYAAVVEQKMGLPIPADLYLEGSDQHRGWFHSSLLAAIGARDEPPYKAVLTHGFVVDGEGHKYSKSAGNYIPPENVISESGSEILRLWVSAEDYRGNIRVSNEILVRLKEAYRKIRNTGRFLLGNLYDFDLANDYVKYENLDEIDRYALHLLQQLIQRVTQAYKDYAFHVVFHEINRFCTVDLSAFYLDILKDRLYTTPASGTLRRGSQTVIFEIARVLSLLMAPVLCFTADEIWEHLPEFKGKSRSVHLGEFPTGDESWLDRNLEENWNKLRQVREEVMRALEEARSSKLIGNALEAQVNLYVEGELEELLETYQTRLADIFIVSQVQLLQKASGDEMKSRSLTGLQMSIQKANGEKCERCWKWLTTVGQDPRHPGACHSCTQTLLHP
jgi:isoleucyl-tRNA synthetase